VLFRSLDISIFSGNIVDRLPKTQNQAYD